MRVYYSRASVFVMQLVLGATTVPVAAATCSSVVHLASAPNPAAQGVPVTFTSGVTAAVGCVSSQTPTGTITLTDTSASPPAPIGTITLDATGAGTLAVSALATGSHTIGASYSGDSNYTPGTAQALVQTILASLTATATTLSSSLNPSQPGQSVTFTASITPPQATVAGVGYRPTGTVAFYDGATPLGNAGVVNGAGRVSLSSATLQVSSLAAGSHNIQAVYSGDNVFGASTSAVLVQLQSGSGTGGGAATAHSQPRSAHVDLYFPQFANGGSPAGQQWQTTFTFVNVDASVAHVSLWLYDDNGNPLTLDLGTGPASVFNFTVPANGLQIMRSPLGSSALVTGWAYAQADIPVQASVAFRMYANGAPQQEVTAQPTLPALSYTAAASAFLGVALANPFANTPTNILLTLYDSAGNQVDGLVSLALPAHGHTSFNLWQKFPSLQSNTNFAGVLYVQGLDPTRPDRFIGWTMNSDASTILSAQPPGDSAWPISHFDRIWQVWSIVLDAASGLDSSFTATPSVGLNILSDSQVNAFAASGGAQVSVTYALSQLINDSDSEMAFALAHMLGHVYQMRHGGQTKYVPGDAEADADQWALNIMLAARYDPYSLPGALAKIAMATSNSQLTSTYDGQNSAGANASLSARLAGAYTAIQRACSGTNATACQSYKSVVHPNLPSNAPLAIRGPVN